MSPPSRGRSARPEAVRGREPGDRPPLTSLLRWIGEHVSGFHAAVGVFLTIGLAVCIAAVVLFASVAALVARGATERFDRAVLLALDGISRPWLDGAALEITSLGSAYVTSVILVIATALLWQTRHRYSAVLLWIALAGGWVLNWLLKSLFARPRPELVEWRVPYAGQTSYPSGHAMSAMVFYGTLAYLVTRLEPTRALRRLTTAVFGGVILLVGLSRVYLGVHYPSDVVGGFLVGLAWATLCALGIEAVRFFRGRRPGVGMEERGLERGILDDEVGVEAGEAPAPSDRRTRGG
jgi:undecaprenyl-diphosphatase